MIKARLYDEAVSKIGGVTNLKLIHICVDYITRMETILGEMRVLFDSQNRFFQGSPVQLKKVPDLTEFPDLPPTKVLQNLQTPTTLRTNQESAESGERPAPGSDARTSEAERPQQEAPTPVPEPAPTPGAQDLIPMDTSEMPRLPADRAPVIPSPPTISLTPENPRPKISFSAPVPPLSESTREYMESVRRQVAFTHTLGFQELLNQSQGVTQASPQRSLFRHPASAFGTLPPSQGPPPPPQLPALPAPRRTPPASRFLQLVPFSADEPPARRKAKPTIAPIELVESEDDSAKTTPPGSDERDGSGNQSDSDPPLIPNRLEPMTTRSSGRA